MTESSCAMHGMTVGFAPESSDRTTHITRPQDSPHLTASIAQMLPSSLLPSLPGYKQENRRRGPHFRRSIVLRLPDNGC